jgi:ribosome biogenesis GTPase A
MSQSVWYKKKDDLLYLLNKIDIGEYLTEWEEEFIKKRFEKYLDKTSLSTYYTHDKDNLTDEYIQMCEIKINRYEMQVQREELRNAS